MDKEFQTDRVDPALPPPRNAEGEKVEGIGVGLRLVGNEAEAEEKGTELVPLAVEALEVLGAGWEDLLAEAEALWSLAGAGKSARELEGGFLEVDAGKDIFDSENRDKVSVIGEKR